MKWRQLWFALLLVGVVALVAGCALTEQQAQSIASIAGEVAATAVQASAPAVGLSPEAAGGIAAAIGTAVTAIAAFMIRKTSLAIPPKK